MIHGTWHLLACMMITGLAVGLIEAYAYDLEVWSEENCERFKPHAHAFRHAPRQSTIIHSATFTHQPSLQPSLSERVSAQVWREVS